MDETVKWYLWFNLATYYTIGMFLKRISRTKNAAKIFVNRGVVDSPKRVGVTKKGLILKRGGNQVETMYS